MLPPHSVQVVASVSAETIAKVVPMPDNSAPQWPASPMTATWPLIQLGMWVWLTESK